MTALAGNTFLNMPYMDSVDSLNCALNQNTFDNVDSTDSFLKSELFPQKQQQVSTCAVTSTSSNNNNNNNNSNNSNNNSSSSNSGGSNSKGYNEQSNTKRAPISVSTGKINNSSPSNASSAIDSGISIKSEEFGYSGLLDVDSAISSADSSPPHILLNDFETIPQLSYYGQLYREEDSTSEASFASTSPTMPPNDFSTFQFSDTFQAYPTSYYDIIQQPPPFEPTPTVAQSMDQMRFIIYEPTNEGAPLVPTLNQSSMWPAMVPTDALTRNTYQPQTGLSFPYEFATNSVTSPIDPASSSSSPQLAPQQKQTGVGSSCQQQQQQQQTQQQQQMIKCPHEDCPKTFSRLYNLKAHLRSHSPARPYQCPMCPRSFSRKHDLQRHIRVHTGVKPYQCPCCHKAFARTDALRRHFKMEETCRNSPEVQNMKTRRRYSDLH